MPTEPSTGPINTRKVQGRRTLRFSTLQEIRVEAQRLAAAERAGTLKVLGNWTLGQNLGHLALWMTLPMDKIPPSPWFIRLLGPLIKGRFLKGPIPTGFRMSGVEGGTLGIEPISTEEGLRRLVAAIDEARGFTEIKHPVFGHMTVAQRIALHCRHAELHLSFLVP